MQTPFRLPPQMRPDAYVTYSIEAPLETHWRKASCEEVACLHYLLGWQITADERTDLGQAQAHYIRTKAGRRFSEDHNPAGLTVFTFEAGQKCFRQHQSRIEREEIFEKKAGDFRIAHPPNRVMRPDDWVDDFAEHQEKLAHELEKG